MNEDLNVSSPHKYDEIELLKYKTQLHYIFVYGNTDQTIPGTWSPQNLNFNKVDKLIGDGFAFNNDKITCNYAGLVHIEAHAITYPGADTNQIRMEIKPTGVGYFQHGAVQGNHLDIHGSYYWSVNVGSLINTNLCATQQCVCYYRMIQVRYIEITV